MQPRPAFFKYFATYGGAFFKSPQPAPPQTILRLRGLYQSKAGFLLKKRLCRRVEPASRALGLFSYSPGRGTYPALPKQSFHFKPIPEPNKQHTK